MKKNNKFIVKIFIGFIVGVIAASLYNILNLEGTVLGYIVSSIKMFGTLFVGSLKAIAPLLVFILIISSIAQHKGESNKGMVHIVLLYLTATFFAALTAVTISFAFPTELILDVTAATDTAPANVGEVLLNVVNNIIDNPIRAIVESNYLGILFWSILIGIGFRTSNDSTKEFLKEAAEAISYVVKKIISLTPLGIMGIVFYSITSNGLLALINYAYLILVLVGTMLIYVFLINPIIVFLFIRENPYPLVIKCLQLSGIPAFFTRSSAANIPINLEICKESKVKEDIYSVSIPLGATINMTGAAITITTLTLAAAHTVGISVSFPMAVILSLLATISACGASGVAGGSLLLIPLSASLFGISTEVASQVVAIGFVISIIQDSCETVMNSSSDVLYTIAVDRRLKRLEK